MVLWIKNNDLSERIGGANLSDYYWIELLRKTHQVDICTGKNIAEFKDCNINNYDLVIFGNLNLLVEYYEFLKKIKHYVVILHGLLNPEPFSGFYSHAHKVITVSPLHKKLTAEKFKLKNVTFSPPYIPPLFYNKGGKRSGYVYLGDIAEYKGIKIILKYAQEHKISVDFYGNMLEKIVTESNCKGKLQYHEVNDIMNKYQYFVWFLDRIGSYGRTLAEALLTGMKLIVNKENFGIFSYGWNFENPQVLRQQIGEEYLKFPSLLE